MRYRCVVWALSLSLALPGLNACGDDDPTGPSDSAFSSRAYKGHANDADMNHLVAAYPDIVGTRLDDCQSCHAAGEVTAGTKVRFKNAGRSAAAIRAIADMDSDGDGSSNKDEIGDLRYPGNAESKPGQPRARLLVLDMEELQAMTAHEEFLLANSHKQQFDDYALYRGVKVRDLLTAVGVDLASITGVTLIAADGYMKDFTAEAALNQYPDGVYYSGLDTDTKGADCGFVSYPASLPAGLSDGAAIPHQQWLLLAYGRDGGAMDSSYLDPVSGQIEGEGPLRIVVPQATAGSPDRGSS